MRPVTDAPPHPAAILLLQFIEELCAAIAQATGLNLFARLMMIPVRRQLRGMAAVAAEAIAEAAARTPDAPPTLSPPTFSPWDPSTPKGTHPDTPSRIQPRPRPPHPRPSRRHTRLVTLSRKTITPSVRSPNPPHGSQTTPLPVRALRLPQPLRPPSGVPAAAPRPEVRPPRRDTPPRLRCRRPWRPPSRRYELLFLPRIGQPPIETRFPGAWLRARYWLR